VVVLVPTRLMSSVDEGVQYGGDDDGVIFGDWAGVLGRGRLAPWGWHGLLVDHVSVS